MLYNDDELKKKFRLPRTEIETDSYVALQLLERYGTLGFDSLKWMAEQVDGSFCFTVLDCEDSLYFIKGDNPLCIVRFPDTGLILYASTDLVLENALKLMSLRPGKAEAIDIECGDILRIDKRGKITRDNFDASRLYQRWWGGWQSSCMSYCLADSGDQREYIGQLRRMVERLGYRSGCVDEMLAEGFTTDDIEDMIYCGEL